MYAGGNRKTHQLSWRMKVTKCSLHGGLCKISSYYNINCDTGGPSLVDVDINLNNGLTVYAKCAC